MSDPGAPRERFEASFARWASRVRARLVLGRVLTGAALALAFGALLAGGFWLGAERVPALAALRPWTALAGLVGALAGVAVARSRRWTDRDVALFIDGRLGADETVSTAVEIAPEQGAAHDVVVRQAEAVLSRASARTLRTPLWSRVQILLPVGAAAIAYLSWIPAPVAPVAEAAEPGEEIVQLAEISGLEKVMELSALDARDEDQRGRLDDLAKRAEALRDQVRAGMPKREAQAEIAKLRDDLLAERMSFGDGERQKGLEAAIGKLGENADLSKAARALGDRDLVGFDQEMQKLANDLEKSSRERAQEEIEEAAKAARKAGAQDVAKELEQQKKLLGERAEATDNLRDLAESLGDQLGKEGKDALEGLESGDPEAAQKLAEALDDALGGLTDKELERLKEKLKKQLEQRGDSAGEPGPKQHLEDLADRLDTPEGREQLRQMLKQMANQPPQSGESQRQEQLDDAQRGAGEAQRQLGAPMPVAGGQGAPQPGGGKGQGDPGSAGKDQGKGGPGKGGGDADKGDPGQTAPVEGPGVVSHAPSPLNPGAPMPGSVVGRTAGRAGDTANQVGGGALGAVGPGEVGAVDRSDVPEEYREQVGRYFQP